MKRFSLVLLFSGLLILGFASQSRAEISPGSHMEFFGTWSKEAKPAYDGNVLLLYNDYRDQRWGGFIGARGSFDDSIKVFGGGYWRQKKISWIRLGVGGGSLLVKSKSPRYFGFGLLQLGDNSTDFFLLATVDFGRRAEYEYSYRIDASLLSADDYSVRPGFLVERFSGVGPKVLAELDRKSKMVLWIAALWSSAFFDTKTTDPSVLVGLRFNFDRI